MSSKLEWKSCKHCGVPIVFDDNIVSKSGKRKPINEWNHQVHDCKFSPFNVNKARKSAEERKQLGKIQEWEVINNLKNKIAAINNRLWNYELKLVVTDREDI